MELIAAVAIGLNPYIGTFVLAALAAFTTHVPQGALFSVTPGLLVCAVAALAGVAAPIDFVLGKFVRFAGPVRRTSQFVAPIAGALGATAVTTSSLPLPLIAAVAAVTSWLVAVLLTEWAARASRSAAWVGLGHIPVLMAAATAAACMIPLGLAKPGIGYFLVAFAVSGLLAAAAFGRRSTARRTSSVTVRGTMRIGSRSVAR